MDFREIKISDIETLTIIYVDTFNSPPWNDKWTVETASKRLKQMINCEDFYGILAYENDLIYGMILGSEEQFYNGAIFNIKEFCVKNEMRSKGLGTIILNEFEKRLKEKGISEIILLTSKEDKTEGFYHRRGLKSHEKMVLMCKKL
ncbi:GNAT family N-acetyltransferase [Clostridium fallax]|uniref:Ribosomal protein S18 acetylase RimI n=1 Tax=Clostridium fallax TaxID=1533 RepID=A0A1M4XLT8_9CLOT|nr:GNAT family N-acetyltransferase [Clostridium fallax]SHE94378.1 Ribosomal protein S18 acetylase RimI [Clostridium fallax]SQB06358.1 GNAT family acetyltransferase [Clostridium fallax]